MHAGSAPCFDVCSGSELSPLPRRPLAAVFLRKEVWYIFAFCTYVFRMEDLETSYVRFYLAIYSSYTKQCCVCFYMHFFKHLKNRVHTQVRRACPCLGGLVRSLRLPLAAGAPIISLPTQGERPASTWACLETQERQGQGMGTIQIPPSNQIFLLFGT
jgi:hypothetical protein